MARPPHRRRDQQEAAQNLRALLEKIDDGEVEATPLERAYLAGALNVLGS